MSGYNSDTLASLQGDLKKNVIMSPQLFDLLEVAQGGFVTRAEAMDVRSNASPMVRLIEILRGKMDSRSYSLVPKMVLTLCNLRWWLIQCKLQNIRVKPYQ